MRYASIRNMDISNGEGIGVALFTQGCPFHCKNCFNPDTHDFSGGKEFGLEEKNLLISCASKAYIERFSILGGEPLIPRNIEPLKELILLVKESNPKIKIWVYTGNLFENIKEVYKDLLELVDIMVDGLFVDELKDLNLKYKGSSNQRVIDVKKSLQSDEIVLYLE